MLNPKYIELPRLLAILAAETGSYSYIDKISNAPNRELALKYIQEALRDYNSLLTREAFDNQKAFEETVYLNTKNLDEEIEQIKQITNPRTLKETLAYISAKALTKTIWLRRKQEAGKSESEEGEKQ
jgi:CRISPR-associated protein Csa5